MKVILDTNVFVSGVFFSGPPFKILQAWRAGKFTLVLSADILDEYRRLGEILAGEFPGIDLEPVIEFVEQNAVALTVPPLAEGVSDDPDDD